MHKTIAIKTVSINATDIALRWNFERPRHPLFFSEGVPAIDQKLGQKGFHPSYIHFRGNMGEEGIEIGNRNGLRRVLWKLIRHSNLSGYTRNKSLLNQRCTF